MEAYLSHCKRSRLQHQINNHKGPHKIKQFTLKASGTIWNTWKSSIKQNSKGFEVSKGPRLQKCDLVVVEIPESMS